MCLLLFITFLSETLANVHFSHQTQLWSREYSLLPSYASRNREVWLMALPMWVWESGSEVETDITYSSQSLSYSIVDKMPHFLKVKKSLELVFWLGKVDTYSCYYLQQEISVLGVMNSRLHQKKNHHKRKLIELFKLPSCILQLFLGRFIPTCNIWVCRIIKAVGESGLWPRVLSVNSNMMQQKRTQENRADSLLVIFPCLGLFLSKKNTKGDS